MAISAKMSLYICPVISTQVMKPDFFVSSPTSKTFIQYKSHHYGLSLLRALSHGLKVVCIERVVPTKESWTFSSTPTWEIGAENRSVECYCYVLLSLLLLSMTILIIGFTGFTPTIHFKSITKCDSFFIKKCYKCYYKVRQFYYKVR